MPRTHLSRRSDTRRDLIAEIQQRRKERHITLEKLGRRYHVTGQHIGKQIRQMSLDYDTLVDMMDYLEFPADRILWYCSGGRFKETEDK